MRIVYETNESYDWDMSAADIWPESSVTSDRARTHWSETLDRVQREPVTITHRGRDRAVVVTPEWFQRALDALEDLEDIEAARAAREDTEPPISHSDLMKELGLDPE
jgi:prevent-host-death family protein